MGLLEASLAFSALSASAPNTAPQNLEGFVIRRGTNLGQWLSQDFRWTSRAVFITANSQIQVVDFDQPLARLPRRAGQVHGVGAGRE